MSGTAPSARRRCCRRFVFHGQVQGVGFRYTAASAARAFQVSGYVRNCADGTVELLADGYVEDVERLLNRLETTFATNIERQTVQEISLSEPLDGFEIRH